MKTLCILVRTVGPYHHARFNTLSQHFNVNVLETQPNIGEYDWQTIESEDVEYELYKNRISNKKDNKRNIETYLEGLCPDFILTHGWSDFEYLVALKFAKNEKIPIITLTDSTLIDYKRTPLKESIKQIIASSFDAYFAAGKKSIEYLNSLGICNNIFTPCDVVDNDFFDSRTRAIRNGTAEKKFTLPPKYILCVSRLIPKKNIQTLLDSYAEVLRTQNNYKYSLVIVGSGHLKTEIEEQIKILGIENRVSLHNFAQYNELPEFYASASALIIPSISDQWGLVVNEAMACGLPVLVSKNCGCSVDLVVEGENGIDFMPQKNEIIKSLNEFSSFSDDTLRNMGEKSKSVISYYSLDKFVKSTIEMTKVQHIKLNIMQKAFLALLIN